MVPGIGPSSGSSAGAYETSRYGGGGQADARPQGGYGGQSAATYDQQGQGQGGGPEPTCLLSMRQLFAAIHTWST